MKGLDPFVRFMDKVYPCPLTGCWLWGGTTVKWGTKLQRPVFSYLGKLVHAYKFAWEHKNGKVPDGLVLDHYRCDNPMCANPDHVRPVTHFENIMRGTGEASKNASKRECPKCNGPYKQTTRGKIQRYCPKCKAARAKELIKSKRSVQDEA